jgi:TPR repeat protein
MKLTHILTHLALVLLSGSSCFARLGETITEVESRYGAPTRKDETYHHYRFNGFKIAVIYSQGRSACELLTSMDDDKVFDEKQCLAIASAIAGDGKWERVVGKLDLFGKGWEQGTNAVAYYKKEILNPASLMVMSYAHFTERIEQIKANQQKLANSFAASPSKSTAKAEPDVQFEKAQREGEEREKKARIDRAIAAKEAQLAKQTAIQLKVLKFQQDQAANGSPSAQYDLGMRYLRGDGVEKDETLARQWLEKSAAQDNAQAKAALQQYFK